MQHLKKGEERVAGVLVMTEVGQSAQEVSASAGRRGRAVGGEAARAGANRWKGVRRYTVSRPWYMISSEAYSRCKPRASSLFFAHVVVCVIGFQSKARRFSTSVRCRSSYLQSKLRFYAHQRARQGLSVRISAFVVEPWRYGSPPLGRS